MATTPTTGAQFSNTIPPLIRWGLVDSVWSAPNGPACRAAAGHDGACWAFIVEKARFIVFGRYPYEEQWRPFLGMLALIGLVAMSCNRANWKPWLAGAWVG